MNLEELYRGAAEGGEAGKRSEELLSQTHWLSSLADFDPRTGAALPMNFTELLRRSCHLDDACYPKDRVWHLVEHSRQSVLRLMDNLSEEPRRENAFMPIRAVRELDTASFVALSRRPGRNIREKLADKPYMKAVRHYQSVDTPENRLFKAYVKKIVEILELRRETLNVDDPLLPTLKRWLKTDEAMSISRWKNLPPNNTLISHRDYRKVWDSWRWLQTLDEDIDKDDAWFAERCNLKDRWTQLADVYLAEEVRFAEMPVLIDWSRFSIESWMDEPLMHPDLFERTQSSLPISYNVSCVDFSRVYPAYACDGEKGLLADAFIWQKWIDPADSAREFDLCLFESDAFYRNPCATTISAPDLFFSKDYSEDDLDAAARSFANRLKDTFPADTLIWLTPDCLNEFELVVIRRNVNAFYSKAEPLPRSVAAVLAHVDYEEISHDGYLVAVVDSVNAVSCITVLRATYNPELKAALPETRGYVWEREIPQVVDQTIAIDDVYCEIAQVDEMGLWSNDYNPYGTAHLGSEDVDISDDNGIYDRIISLNTSPVTGGLRLMQLQRHAGKHPIWRNRIPELMTPATDEYGTAYDHFFVGEDIKVEPVRGKPVPIQQAESFTIPAWCEYIPLYQGGEGIAPLEYAAKLTSPDIPHNDEIKCQLKMTYTYGADNPYDLVFIPYSHSLHEIHVEWRPKVAMSDASSVGPVYPTPLRWEQLRNQTKPSGEPVDFFEWAEESSVKLKNMLCICEPLRGKLINAWVQGSGKNKYNFVQCNDKDVYINESGLLYESCESLPPGTEIYFYLKRRSDESEYADGASSDRDATIQAYREKRKLNLKRTRDHLRNTLLVIYGKVWSDGRSIDDEDCPVAFKRQQREMMGLYRDLLEEEGIPFGLRNDILTLLCYTGVDFPEECVRMVEQEYEGVLTGGKSFIYERPLGYLLADLSKPWKINLLHRLAICTDSRSLPILSQAIWHNSGLIEHLSAEEIRSIAGRICSAITYYSKAMLIKGHDTDKQFVYDAMSLTRCLELLLGLLISRNSKEFEIHNVLQPNRDITKVLLKQIEALEDDFAWRPKTFKTRIEMDLPSVDESNREEHLLEALRLYLSGDERINAIKITGVSDNA